MVAGFALHADQKQALYAMQLLFAAQQRGFPQRRCPAPTIVSMLKALKEACSNHQQRLIEAITRTSPAALPITRRGEYCPLAKHQLMWTKTQRR